MNVLSSNRWIVLVTVACLLPCSAAGATGAEDMAGLFPDLDGWTKDGSPEFFSPENLFEYINGAADLYLTYEFEELAALSYDGGGKRSLSIDIYRHADLRNAFGIYSQERPQEGKFLPIGTEGYYDSGLLNFFHGRYYVKLIGFELGKEDEKVLTEVASGIAKRLGGDRAFPAALDCFPAEGKVERSERFIAQDVLGHGFLHGAYAADYEVDGAGVRVFLIEGTDEADAGAMLEKYLELARSGGVVMTDGTVWRFSDPRRTSAGLFHLKSAGRYLWGLSSNDVKTADRLLGAIENNLKSRGFIE